MMSVNSNAVTTGDHFNNAAVKNGAFFVGKNCRSIYVSFLGNRTVPPKKLVSVKITSGEIEKDRHPLSFNSGVKFEWEEKLLEIPEAVERLKEIIR